MKVWQLVEISEEEAERRIRETHKEIINLLRDPGNLAVMRHFCQLLLYMQIFWKPYALDYVRWVGKGIMPEGTLMVEQAEAKAKAGRRRRKAA